MSSFNNVRVIRFLDIDATALSMRAPCYVIFQFGLWMDSIKQEYSKRELIATILYIDDIQEPILLRRDHLREM